ncbi:MAG: hypothetical protein WB611_21795 [Stellaceae bacterium]
MAMAGPDVRPQYRMRLLGWRRLRQGKLFGFAEIELPIGLKLYDVPVLRGQDGQPWAAMPTKPQVDRDGHHRRDDTGKPAYARVVEWRSRRLEEAFSKRVVGLVRQAYPDDLVG